MSGNRGASTFELARDELFGHIHRCGVLKADADQQAEWMDDTLDYISERYPDLSGEDLGRLRTIGMRFCSPVIAHGGDHTALDTDRQTASVA